VFAGVYKTAGIRETKNYFCFFSFRDLWQ